MMRLFSRATCGSGPIVAAAVAGFFVSVSPFACGQTTADASAPKLDRPFTFTLGPTRDYALGATITTIEQHDALRRTEELEDANASVLSKALDLLRYVPISLGGSEDDDDFFTPAYLQPGYARVPTAPSLFDPR